MLLRVEICVFLIDSITICKPLLPIFHPMKMVRHD